MANLGVWFAGEAIVDVWSVATALVAFLVIVRFGWSVVAVVLAAAGAAVIRHLALALGDV
jgi:hypothetical protein